MITEETLSNASFTETELLEESSVRKSWLVSFFLISVISALLVFIFLLGEVSLERISNTGDLTLVVVSYLLLSILITIPSSWITYYCSYKKRGTAWLVLILIGLPLQDLINIFRAGIEWDMLNLPLVVIIRGVEVYYWINCFQLYRVNSLRDPFSDSNFKDSKDCALCVTKMENSSNIDDLDEAFSHSIKKYPQWEMQLSKIYKNKKNSLFENANHNSLIR